MGSINAVLWSQLTGRWDSGQGWADPNYHFHPFSRMLKDVYEMQRVKYEEIINLMVDGRSLI